MRTLITGGAGFLGSHISDRLLSRGDEVLALDNLATGRRVNLSESDRLEFVKGTIADRDLVDACFDRFRPEVVVHAAAAFKDPDDWEEDLRSNALGTVHVVQAAKRHAVSRVVYLQTSLCYGRPLRSPIPIDHPLRPFTSYAISKTAGEQFVALSGVAYVSLRLANIYGPRHGSGPIPSFYRRLKEGQACYVTDTRRDFTYIDDFLDLMDRILLEKPDATGCYNVCTGSDISIRELLGLMADRMGVDLPEPVDVIPPNSDDVATLLLDPGLTEETFGWKARTSLTEGIDSMIEWFDKHGVADAYTHLRIGDQGAG